MRCPDCNKFVGLDTQEPEEEDSIYAINYGDDGIGVEGSYTIERNCAECGLTLKSAVVEIDEEVELYAGETGEHDECEFSVGTSDVELVESGGGRYVKNMIGVRVTGTIVCDDHGREVAVFTAESSIAASEFDECA